MSKLIKEILLALGLGVVLGLLDWWFFNPPLISTFVYFIIDNLVAFIVWIITKL